MAAYTDIIFNGIVKTFIFNYDEHEISYLQKTALEYTIHLENDFTFDICTFVQ